MQANALAAERRSMNAPLPNHVLPQAQLRPMPGTMLQALKDHFGGRCSTALAVREQHGRGESVYDAAPPEAVVFCESNDDVVWVVKLAHQHAVPVIPYGTGSSLEGHLLAVQGGVSVDVSRMDKVLSINAEDLTVTVQAGVTREQLNREIKDPACSSPSTPAPTRRWAAWPPPAPAAPTPCATAPCVKTCWA